MFYSHEILTSRKHGVATVWLVATLGAKSNTKKVNRKAIEKVDIKNVCQTIIKPEVPLALRLQSNLLYGVSRVNQQQWEYLLSDAQTAQNLMRTLMRTVRNGQLDPNAGKAQPEQLVLVDDPAFAIDSALPALDLDFLNLENLNRDNTLRSTQSMLSMRSRSDSVTSIHLPSLHGLDISSSIGGGGYQPPMDPFGGSSAQKPFIGAPHNNDEGMMTMDDDLFDFDADGNMRDILPGEREARQAVSVTLGRLGSDSGAIVRVQQEHENARALQIVDQDGDYNMQVFDNEYDLPLLPDADPFPVPGPSGTLGSQKVNNAGHLLSDPEPEQTSSDSVEAQQRQKRKRAPKNVKTIKADNATSFKNTELIAWEREYSNNMAAIKLAREHQTTVKNSKKTAFQYVWGAGFNEVGNGIGSERFTHPLAMFSGAALFAKVTGVPTSTPEANKKGVKRANATSDEEQSTPNKRPAPEDEVARGFDDDALLQTNDNMEQSVELGRDAPSSLADYPSSAMPWNKSASLVPRHPNLHSSRPGSQAGRRLTSASPLQGHGSLLPLGRDLMGEQDEMVMYGRSDSLAPLSQHDFGFDTGGDVSSSHDVAGFRCGASQDFELFGAAAGVDTQTAADSQWVRSVLDKESNNFFEYIKNSIDERYGPSLQDPEQNGDEDGDIDELTRDAVMEADRTVSFDELFEPGKNSHVVAAQAFYHVLTLATRRRVRVTQDKGLGEGEYEPFGEIWIGVA